MSLKKLFRSSELLNYYKSGKLDEILKKYKHIINEKTFLGAGGDASGFIYNDHEVIKICSKTVGYFRKFPNSSNMSQSEQFQSHISDFYPYFLPINEIIYENRDIIIYTQNFCDKLSKTKINHHMVVTIFEMVKLMLEKDSLCTDIGAHNMGIYQGQLVLFDYHGLHPLLKNGQLPQKKWWGRLMRNLIKYMCAIYAPSKGEKYSMLIKNLNSKAIKQIEKDDFLPETFVTLLKYLVANNKNASIEEIIYILDECIETLLSSKKKH